MRELGIYIHIPFCKRKCEYCDFISFNKNEEIQNKYVECLIKSIENSSKKYGFNEFYIKTIYFGGGTPSFIDSKNIVKIMDVIKKQYTIANDAEITIEINPGTINEEKLKDYKKCGINRISMGCQSTNNEILKMIGRIHTYEEFLDSYKLIKDNGFENVNVDLMLGLPNQTVEILEDSVNKIISLNPNHISIYSLIVEEGTGIANKIDSGELKLPEEELEREMYSRMKELLEQNGYGHYEISNFAKKGFESKHNMDCWNQKEYLGFGLASHSYFDGKRFSNIENLNSYMKNIEEGNFENNIIIHEEQTIEDKRKEFMLLGLRKIEGVSISEFERRFEINPLFYFRFEISKLEEEDLIEVDLDNIKLTKKGLDLANLVWEEFV